MKGTRRGGGAVAKQRRSICDGQAASKAAPKMGAQHTDHYKQH
jgi:hypothetical protein